MQTGARSLMEKWIRSEILFKGRILSLRVGEAQLEDGTLATREVVEHGGGVGVVPLHDGKVIFVKQFRIALGRSILEVPAGRLEPNETPEHRAHCELEEEIGYRAGRMVAAGSYHCSPGFTNEIDHLFLAFDLTKTAQKLEFDERIEIVEIPLEEVRRMLSAHAFDNVVTAIGVHELFRYLESHGDQT